MTMILMNSYILHSINVPDGWKPTSVSGCKLWLDASQGVSQQSNLVSQWSDMSGNNNHAIQLTGSSQPILSASTLNNLPTIMFDGNNDFFYLTSSLLINPDFSIFIVYKNNNPGGICGLIGNPSNNQGLLHYSDKVMYLINSNNLGTLGVQPYAITYQDLSILKSGSTAQLYNMNTFVSQVPGPVGDILINRIGYEGFGYASANIAEIIVYDNNISIHNKYLVDTYLCYKYGFKYNIVPTMTSANTPYGIVTTNSQLQTNNYSAWRAFDRATGIPNSWVTTLGAAYPVWIIYQFPFEVIINKYIISSTVDPTYVNAFPKNWTLSGSTDGTTWFGLDTQTNQSIASAGEIKTYIFSNITPYSYYKMNITANNGGYYSAIIGELELLYT